MSTSSGGARHRLEPLEGCYVVLIKNRLQANEEADPGKWALWKIIWDCTSFEELARRAPDPVNTTRTGRRITWRTEVRWALKREWIKKVQPSASGPSLLESRANELGL